ncbi:hypothetical protein EG831_04825 [bacterium]|nr:hypothetical protein [bacterium]
MEMMGSMPSRSFRSRHSRAGGNPGSGCCYNSIWIPAFAGMTLGSFVNRRTARWSPPPPA